MDTGTTKDVATSVERVGDLADAKLCRPSHSRAGLADRQCGVFGDRFCRRRASIIYPNLDHQEHWT